ncbi:MAG: hypothetical protein JOY71_06480 [Acetobacteraceae bacterium]|nr:hypothetical protein [Acetobacteraceae bacterium]
MAAANKLAYSLADARPQYRRGSNYWNLTKAILHACIEQFTGREADSVKSTDLSTLEKAVSDWFTANVKPRTFFVPCSIIPDHPPLAHARPFAMGPVAPWIASVHKNGPHINTTIDSREPGLGLSGEAFDYCVSKNCHP